MPAKVPPALVGRLTLQFDRRRFFLPPSASEPQPMTCKRFTLTPCKAKEKAPYFIILKKTIKRLGIAKLHHTLDELGRWEVGGEWVGSVSVRLFNKSSLHTAPLLRSSFLCSSRYSAAHGIDLLQPPQGFPQLRACLQGALLHARLSAKINCHHPSHHRIHNCRMSCTYIIILNAVGR